MKLAERYVDFSTLVSICELKSDSELLNSYLDKFQNTVSVIYYYIFEFFNKLWLFIQEIRWIRCEVFHGEEKAQLPAQEPILEARRYIVVSRQVQIPLMDKGLQKRQL